MIDDILSQFYNTPTRDDIAPITVGVVINNNDPQQMGRVQVLIPSYGEHAQHVEQDHLPWASYVTPFGGVDDRSARGPGKDGQNASSPYGHKSEGFVAYGMWNIPKIGAHVILMCVDQDPNRLYWMGCVYPNSTTHTLPNGRYITDPNKGTPDGPLTSSEKPIEPLYSNTKKAFGDHDNFEWRTRGAGYSAAAISPSRIRKNIESDTNEDHTGTSSKVLDDRDVQIDENDGQVYGKDLKHRQGYALSRTNPEKDTNDAHHQERGKATDRNLESTCFSWTTPGGHAMSMDDRPEHCRMHFRSITGHQVILDDTNERIYVSTAEGRNWVEMDSDGHTYLYCEESFSVRARGDINLSSDSSVRIKGKKGVHIQSDDIMRFHSVEDMSIVSDEHMFVNVDKLIRIDGTDLDVHISDRTVLNSDVLELIASTHTNVKTGIVSIDSDNFKLDGSGHIENIGDISTKSIQSSGTVKASGNMQAADFGTSTYSLLKHFHTGNMGSPTSPASGGGNATAPNVNSSSPNEPVVLDNVEPDLAFWTNIVPDHEPWARTWMKNPIENLEHEPELEYNNRAVGKHMKKSGVEDDRSRNPLWHR